MGLAFSHTDAQWSYSGFNSFRRKLAAEIGFEWPERPYDEKTDAWFQRVSKCKDPIIPLLVHSDCDGELSPEECASIGPRLRELVHYWPNEDYDKVTAQNLAEGMSLAAHKNEPLRFC